MKPILLLLALCTALAPQTPLAAQDKDDTPVDVQDKMYRWGSGVRENRSLAARMTPLSSQWVNRTSASFDGYVILVSGERRTGKLVLHQRYSRDMELKGNRVSSAATIERLILTHADGVDSLTLADVAQYGAQFKVSDWTPDRRSKAPSDSYHPGYVQLSDGDRREGLVALHAEEGEIAGMRTFPRVYFAADAASPVEIYLAPMAARPGLVTAIEVGQNVTPPVRYTPIRGYLIEQGAWVAKLESRPRQLSAEQLVPGSVEFRNGAVLRGRVALQSGRAKSFAYLIDEDQDLLYIRAGAGIRVINVTEDGAAQQYVVADGEFVNNADLLARFAKDESLHEGTIVLASGEELAGKLSLRRAVNLVRSYRIPLGAYFVPPGDAPLITYYDSEEIDYLDERSTGAALRYVPLDGSLVPQAEYLAGLEASKARDATRNLHAGYVELVDGTKVAGRIAQRGGGIVLVDQSRGLTRYTPKDSSLRLFAQTIDGRERRFIPLQAGLRAFSGPQMEFVEVLRPEGAFSYYRNPNPTHLRRLSTALAKSAINTGVSLAGRELANEAAKQEVQSQLAGTQPNLADVAGATAAAAQTQANVYETTTSMVEVSDEGGIYHREWVVLNNSTNEKTVVYSGNETEELTRLLNTCPRYATLERRAARRLLNVKNLDEAIQFLNSCR